MKGPTKVPLSSIVGIIYGGSSMTFTLRKKKLIKNMRKKRKYIDSMDVNFSQKQEIFEKLDTSKDTDYGENNEGDTSTPVFYSWECLSFLRSNGTTLDLAIHQTSYLMALIHVVHKHVYNPPPDIDFLYPYKILKFKMKIAYESW